MDELLKEYAEICKQEKAISARKETIKLQIEEEMGQNPVTHKTEFGTFKMVGRSSYKYSQAVTTLAEDLKMAQKDEIEQGIAEETINYSLRFNG